MDETKRILAYLKVPKAFMADIAIPKTSIKDIKLKSNGIQGLYSVLHECFKKQATLPTRNLMGTSNQQIAFIHQWLQYSQMYLSNSIHPIPAVFLKEMDSFLAPFTYFGGHSISVADVLLYIQLHPTFKDMSHHDKEKYQNLSRWFRHMQEDRELRKNNPKVIFSNNVLYAGVTHV